MESYVPPAMTSASTFFFGDNGYSDQSCNRNIWERTRISLPSTSWQMYPNIPCTSQCELQNCNMHPQFYDAARGSSLLYGAARGSPQLHDTARGSSLQERFYYNYEPAMYPYVSSTTSMAVSLPHSRAENDNNKKLACEICKKMFLRPSALKVHMRIHNGEKPFRCPQCPQSFSQSGNLTVHMRMHTGEKPFVCVVCLKRFSQSNSMRVHMRRHTGEKPYQCSECGKRFADRSTLVKHHRVHIKAADTGEQPTLSCSH